MIFAQKPELKPYKFRRTLATIAELGLQDPFFNLSADNDKKIDNFCERIRGIEKR